MRGRIGNTCRNGRGTVSGRRLTSRVTSVGVSCTTRYQPPRRRGGNARALILAHCSGCSMRALRSAGTSENVGAAGRRCAATTTTCSRQGSCGSVMRDTAGCPAPRIDRSEEHTSELQSLAYLVCRLLLEKKKKKTII